MSKNWLQAGVLERELMTPKHLSVLINPLSLNIHKYCTPYSTIRIRAITNIQHLNISFRPTCDSAHCETLSKSTSYRHFKVYELSIILNIVGTVKCISTSILLPLSYHFSIQFAFLCDWLHIIMHTCIAIHLQYRLLKPSSARERLCYTLLIGPKAWNSCPGFAPSFFWRCTLDFSWMF